MHRGREGRVITQIHAKTFISPSSVSRLHLHLFKKQYEIEPQLKKYREMLNKLRYVRLLAWTMWLNNQLIDFVAPCIDMVFTNKCLLSLVIGQPNSRYLAGFYFRNRFQYICNRLLIFIFSFELLHYHFWKKGGINVLQPTICKTVCNQIHFMYYAQKYSITMKYLIQDHHFRFSHGNLCFSVIVLKLKVKCYHSFGKTISNNYHWPGPPQNTLISWILSFQSMNGFS